MLCSVLNYRELIKVLRSSDTHISTRNSNHPLSSFLSTQKGVTRITIYRDKKIMKMQIKSSKKDFRI